MSKPVSQKPLRKVAAICAYSHDDPLLRNPIIGIAVCCARAPKILRSMTMKVGMIAISVIVR